MKGRRDFLKDACATAALCGMPARIWGAAKMLGDANLVIGVLSDIHIAVAPKRDPLKTHSASLFRHALEYFRDRHVDGVLISGDLTHRGLEVELKTVADIWFEVFPGGRLPDGAPVANLMHYGDHDAEARFYDEKLKAMFSDAGSEVPRSLSDGELRKELWERFFHEPWSPLRHVKVKGYDFILSNFMREKSRSAPENLGERLEQMDLDPARPFFYSQHRYIGGTYLSDEEMWGADNGVAGKVLPKFPNCIAFQGHTHYMLTDPRGVWLGDYVSINGGALRDAPCGRVRENGIAISWYKNDYMREKQMRCIDCAAGHGGSVLSVADDLVTIEHRDFGFDLPLGPDIVFSVDPKARAQNVDAVRKAKSVAPEFEPGAKVMVAKRIGKDRQGRETMQAVVTFPTVRSSGSHPRAHEYFVQARDLSGAVLKEKRVYSPGINLPEAKDTHMTTCVFSAAEIAGEGRIQFSVRPANCWGVKGRPISCQV